MAHDALDVPYIFVALGRDIPRRFTLFPHRRAPCCDGGIVVRAKGHPPLGNLHAFFGSTDDWRPYAKFRIDLFNNHSDSATDDMRTIPRHKIIDPMPGSKGKVIRICLGLVW